MSNSKFKIGQPIITKSGVKGHVTLIMNPFNDILREYYCSMYPGAQSDFVYIECIDLLCTNYNVRENKFTTMQALNIYKEDELILNEEE